MGGTRHKIDSEVPRRITNDSPEGKTRVGRPEGRWIDVVNNEVRRAGVRRCRTDAKDRDGWRRILEVTKAHSGPYYHQ